MVSVTDPYSRILGFHLMPDYCLDVSLQPVTGQIDQGFPLLSQNIC
jgi:hypothetical protein